MPNPGKFHGKRKEFLTARRPMFDAAVENNRLSDVLLQIYAAYFKRFPLDMPEDVEPTDEELALVDDNAPEPEPDTTALDELSGEAYEAALERMKEGSVALEAKKGQIKRWLYYRHMRDHAHDPRSTDPSNPYNALIMQLSGMNREKRPRCKTPANIWCKEPANVALIQAEYDKIAGSIDPRKRVAKRAELASALYKELPEEKKQEYAERARQEHEGAMKKYNEAMIGEISTAPADRQRCISALPQFVQPWLDALARATGFQFALMAGGPEPIRDGRLNVISMYGGTTNGTVPLNFGQAEREAYMEAVLPRFGRYLKSCYTPEECRRRALKGSNAENSLQSVAMDEGASFHSFGHHTSDSVPPRAAAKAALPSGPIPSDSRSSNGHVAGSDTAVSSNTAQIDAEQPTTDSVPSISPTSAPDSGTASSAVGDKDSSPTTSSAAVDKGSSATASMLDNVTQALAHAIESPCASLVPTPAGSTRVSRAASPILSEAPAPVVLAVSLDQSPPPPSPPNGTTGVKRTADSHVVDDDAPVQRPEKRTRTNNAVESNILPPEAPDWIKSATHMLQNGRYPGRWHELIAAWLVYESRNNFADKDRLPSKGRPQVVGEWFKRRRQASFTPKPLPNITLIEREHMAWWRSMQPASRVQEDGTLAAATACTDWPQLCAMGLNGMLSVLASLYFWGMSLTHADADTTSWEAAVDDCLAVIQRLPGPH